MKKDILVIYNPVAGAKKRIDISKIIKKEMQKRDLTYDWFETLPQKTQPFEKAFQDKYKKVIAIGGDGTVSEVAAYMVKTDCQADFGIIAQGTANILAQSLGIPIFDSKKAIIFALDNIGKPIDVMHINNKYYGFLAAGQGYDTTIIKETSRMMKRKFGFLAYVFTVFRTALSYRKQYYHLTIDGERHMVVGKSVMIFNVLNPIGLTIEQDIVPNDGIANVIVISPRSVFDIPGIIVHKLFRKSLDKHPRFQLFAGKQIDIKQKRAKHIQIDGELIKAKRLHIDVLRNAISIIHI